MTVNRSLKYGACISFSRSEKMFSKEISHWLSGQSGYCFCFIFSCVEHWE